MRTVRADRLNAFVVGDADAIGEVLLSPLGDPASGDADGVVCDRAAALVGALTPVLVWMRKAWPSISTPSDFPSNCVASGKS
jgi:hypothetical protein